MKKTLLILFIFTTTLQSQANRFTKLFEEAGKAFNIEYKEELEKLKPKSL